MMYKAAGLVGALLVSLAVFRLPVLRCGDQGGSDLPPNINLYVSGLPIGATEETVKSFFIQYGEVFNSKVLPVTAGKNTVAGSAQSTELHTFSATEPRAAVKSGLGKDLCLDIASSFRQFMSSRLTLSFAQGLCRFCTDGRVRGQVVPRESQRLPARGLQRAPASSLCQGQGRGREEGEEGSREEKKTFAVCVRS